MLPRVGLGIFAVAGWASGVAATSSCSTLPGRWSTMPNITLDGLQFPRQEHSVALVGDDLFVLGGILSFDGTTYPTTNIVQKFNLITKTWTEVAPMPAALNHVNVATVNGKIYYLGGMAATGPTYWNASGASAVYDPRADKWTVLPNMPEERATGSAATVVVGDTVYLPGGLRNTNLITGDQDTTTMFTSYNVVSGEWKSLPDLPAPRDHAGKGFHGHTLYILGGRLFGNKNVTDTVFGYNIYKKRWSTDFAPMPTPRGGCASATLGNLMFTFSGEGDPDTSTGVYPQVEAYDAVRDRWTEYKDMATPLHGTDAVAYKGKIIIPGGAPVTGGLPSQLVQSFTPFNGRHHKN